jgi:HKD family nuclease
MLALLEELPVIRRHFYFNAPPMIIKKLAVPFINEKLLMQAEHCYIATAAISSPGFDFVRTRLSPKCKMDILTGLDEPTSPEALKKIWRHYLDKVSVHIYTKNSFHANVYILDLPYRKSVAFVGSGQFSLEGLKDHEEIFIKIIDPKEIENLKSWFTGYYEYAEPLSEEIIQEYELIYPLLKQREILSRSDKRDVIELTARGFSWDNIKFKNQYFKKEDYQVFANSNAPLANPVIQSERENVKKKLLELHSQLESHIASHSLYYDVNTMVSSIHPANYADGKVREMWLVYGRAEAELKRYFAGARLIDFLSIQILIRQKEIGILIGARGAEGRIDREHLQLKMTEVEYRTSLLNQLKNLGAGYWIEISGERKATESFLHEDALTEFIKLDDWRYYTFKIGKYFPAGDPEINSDLIVETMIKELDKIVALYRLIRNNN